MWCTYLITDIWYIKQQIYNVFVCDREWVKGETNIRMFDNEQREWLRRPNGEHLSSSVIYWQTMCQNHTQEKLEGCSLHVKCKHGHAPSPFFWWVSCLMSQESMHPNLSWGQKPWRDECSPASCRVKALDTPQHPVAHASLAPTFRQGKNAGRKCKHVHTYLLQGFPAAGRGREVESKRKIQDS